MKFVRSFLLSIGITGACCLAFLAAAALVVAKSGTLPRDALPLVCTVMGCAAVFIGALLPAIAAREKGLYLGLAAGGLLAASVAVVSYFLYGLPFVVGSIGKGAAFLLSGAIGGVLGANRKNKVKF